MTADTFDMQIYLYADAITLDGAWASFDWEYHPAEPDVGIMAGSYATKLVEVQIAPGFTFDRAQLVSIFTEKWVADAEERAAEAMLEQREAA